MGSLKKSLKSSRELVKPTLLQEPGPFVERKNRVGIGDQRKRCHHLGIRTYPVSRRVGDRAHFLPMRLEERRGIGSAKWCF